MSVASDTVRHVRVRLRGVPVGARPAAGRRFRSLIERTAWRPGGLSPRAVLLVRAVRTSVRAGQRGADLTRSLRAEMEAQLRHARRPVAGRVPSGAGAVVFADEAEWLACALADRARRRAPAWWWPRTAAAASTTAPGGLGAEALLREHAEHVPAVMEYLYAMGTLPDVLPLLTADVAEALAERVAAAFAVALPPSKSKPTRASTGVPRAGRIASASGLRRDLVERAVTSGAPSPSHRVLVLLALTLARAPSRAHAPAFQVIVRQIRRETDWGTVVTAAPRSEHDARRIQERPSSSATPSGRPEEAPAQNWVAPPHAAGSQQMRDPAAARPPGEEPRRENELARAARAVPAGPVAEHGSGARHPTRTGPGPAPAEASGATGHEDASGPARYPGEAIRTEWAGALYLLHAIEEGGVWGAYERWRLRGRLGPWGLLEAVARTLCGGGEDPLWSLLARLDGREPGVPLGAGVCGRRDGVPDLRWDGLASRPVAPPAALACGPTFGRWLGVVAGSVRARVQQALGGDLEVHEVLRRPGVLFASSSHLDLAQPLGAVALPIRRAGLDRDPGWLPRYGRVVLFHFEDLP